MSFPTAPNNNDLWYVNEASWQYNNGIWKKLRKAPFSSFKSPTASPQSNSGYADTGLIALENPIPKNKAFTVYVNMRSDNNVIDVNSGSVKLGFRFYTSNIQVSSTYFRWTIVDGYGVNKYQHGFDFHQNFKVDNVVLEEEY